MAADVEDGSVDFATLLAEVKVQASDKGEGYTELAELSEGDFESLLHDLFETDLISGDKEAIALTPAAKARVERELNATDVWAEPPRTHSRAPALPTALTPKCTMWRCALVSQ